MSSEVDQARTTPALGEAPSDARLRSLRWLLIPIGIFLLTRVADATMLMLAVRDQFPASTFPGFGVPILRDPHTYWNVIQSWDGQWFRLIAEHGYPRTLPTSHGQVVENQWGFFPLFPALVRVVMVLTHTSYGVAVTLLNIPLGCAGMCVVFRLIESRASRFSAVMTVVVLSTFPSAVVFQAAYSEALSFFLLVSAIWFLTRRQYAGVMVAAVLLSLTRPIVLPLALVVAFHWWLRWRTRESDPFPRRDRWLVGLTAVVVAGSFGLWSVAGWIYTGNPHTYLSSIAAWNRASGKHLNSGVNNWLTHAFTGDNAALVAIVLAVGLQCYFLLRPAARLWAPELRAWSFSYAAFLLLSTWPQSSVSRHLVMAIVPWWPWPEVGDRVTTRRAQVTLAVGVGLVGLALQFCWIRLFWIDGPALYSFP